MATAARFIIDAFEAAGLDIGAICRSVRLEPGALENDIDFSQFDRFLMAAWHAVDDPAIGLAMGRFLRAERFGVVGFAAMTSPTLGTAFERLARYNRLVWGDHLQLQRQGVRATISIASAPPERAYSRAMIDMDVSTLCAFARKFCTHPVIPIDIAFRGPPPPYAKQYLEVLGNEPRFNQPACIVSFRREDFDTRLISANGQLERHFERIAEAALAAHGGDRTGPRVRMALARMLSSGVPTLDAVAHQLCMSGRTLQRKLSDEGARFSDLLDEARKELAQQYLESGRIGVTEISDILGFTDANSFFRAFRRWTGRTPRAYRRWAQAHSQQF